MKALRDEFYFEPRVITEGRVHWYGEIYYADELRDHLKETVYIRDSGTELFIYTLNRDDLFREDRIEAVFRLVFRIQKYNNKRRYGRKND